MHVLTFLHVALMIRINFILDLVVENLGVGSAEKNTVDNTITLKQGKSFRQQKTITMPFVVEMKKILKKMNIVVEDVQGIVMNDGKLSQCI